MADLSSLINTRGQSLQTLVDAAGTRFHYLGIGDVATGLTAHSAWLGAATHKADDVFNASDGMSVGGGVDRTGTDHARPFIVDVDGRLEVNVNPQRGVTTDRSGTLTVANTVQDMMAVNLLRRYLFVQNQDTAEDLWINFTTNAVKDQPSIRLGPLQSYVQEGAYVTTEKVTVIALTVGHKWTAKEA